VRRLTALAITMAGAWLLVSQLSGPPAAATALALGMALIAASIVGWLVAFIRLPRITGYLAFGLLCGPAVANIITFDMARDLRAAGGLAIALVAFIAGLQFQARRAAPSLVRIAGLSFVTLTVAWLGLGVILYAGWAWLPVAPELAGLQRAAAVALAAIVLVGVSPTLTVAVIAEARASGPLSTLATTTSVLVQLLAILLFTLCLEGTRVAFGSAAASGWTIASAALWTLGGSLAFGALVGAGFALYVRFIGREMTLAFLALCAIIAGVGARFQLEPLLAGVAAGLIVQWFHPAARDVLLDSIRAGATPVLVLFFAAIGASLNVEALAAVGIAALAIAGVRFVVLPVATRAGTAVARLNTPEAADLWRALLPTSGIALGFSFLIATEHPVWGPSLQTLIVATVAIFEVVGPVVFRAALAEHGEIGESTGGLVVVSNREPWIHEYKPDGSISVRSTPGGVSVALDALMRERGGVWVAHGAGSADRAVVDEQGSVEVPPDAPSYRLRRVWLSQDEVDGYYAGFANGALWPLCHQAHVRPQFRAEEWDVYQAVNRKFADIVATEAPPDASVFLNDYHLALVAGRLRERRPLLRTAIFWHIPWPDVDRLYICPWRRELLEGLLSNDLVAFQLPRDRRHFVSAASEILGAPVSGDLVFFGDRPVRVVSVPIGADFDRISDILADAELPSRMDRLEQDLELAGKLVGVGVDRLDYTKGIPERMRAIEQVLEREPGLASQLAFVQIGVPSRSQVPAYLEISAEIDAEVARINSRFGRDAAHGPVRYLKRSFPLSDLVALYRRAHFCIVSSLHDGMNLVAKEFVAARDDMDGVLILSELAGAAQELNEALMINPYDERGFADAIARAIAMPPWERRRRMQALHRRVAGRDVLAWASNILDRLERRKGQGFLSG
jgi:trehalose 6-phosphate synthase